ncbi:7-cyano-7-deazaguanine synthase [Thioalkalivibrio sp. AKL10]|uniref:7-cyano-7-deazaguanine synthase n=1 Tax=Thioalkalivibrio sp. AKL10 TaxID=1158158 RepID=UPI00035F3C96|nr:7-cyano-7-deazaguanine synthase [Thioalkalivibrio sp. AKL10]
MTQLTRHVLWTGGFDSTFRVCQILATSKDTLQPHYLVDETRQSTGEEIRAMSAIRTTVEELWSGASCRLLPTKYTSARGNPIPNDIRQAFNTVYSQKDIGTQYPWLTRYARSLGLPLELGIQGGGRLEKTLGPYVWDGELAGSGDTEFEEALLKLFEPFRFPIMDLSKTDMIRIADEQGFRPIMEQTWFCHQPKTGKPCGRCAPCKYAIEQGMGWRIPFLRRIQHRSFWEGLSGKHRAS